ncbi:N-acetylmuramoyl-L-alanine amidase [Heliobacterium chlorum]|uniref:N-acetylmuramoyl-L-alanine amidase n=1 Tax=Heliobacterium chlorum TaxID=2698 RepID=A0ABR7T132_HELCL|nr:N-acetylmuramoyl-L-alanine amidase family protein [Heliobacterium chlorum]MBC9783897.1 N-acetylmuramoyl-L-alanine amidase [Heliobacterium chlorum]
MYGDMKHKRKHRWKQLTKHIKSFPFLLLLSSYFCLVGILGFPSSGNAIEPVNPSVNSLELIIDGERVKSDVPPIIKDDRVLVPLRVVSEYLKLNPTWIEELREVRLGKPGLLILLKPDVKTAQVNDKKVELDVAPVIKDDRTMVPLRFVSTVLGAEVKWIAESRTVTILTTPNSSPSQNPPTAIVPTTTPATTVPLPSTPPSTPPSQPPQVPPTQIPSQPAVEAPVEKVAGIDWQIENGSTVVIHLDAPVEDYKITRLSSPERLIIDFPNLRLGDDLPRNTVVNLSPVKQIRFGQYQEDIARAVIDLTAKVEPQIAKAAGGVEVRFALQPIRPTKETPLVLIDPGHGGSDPGALGPNQTREKDVTLQVALILRAQLQKKGIAVLMTRTEDMFVSLADRGTINDRVRPNLFLSIHANSFARSDVGGTETWYYDDQGKHLASLIQRNVLPITGRNDRGIKQAGFYVLRSSPVPAALLEMAFISNPDEEKLLFDRNFQNRIAQTLCDTLTSYLNKQ